MARKTKTPKWLSVLRKMWTYIGNTILASTYFSEAINEHTLLQITIIFNTIGFLIQTVCDTYFIKEKPNDIYKE